MNTTRMERVLAGIRPDEVRDFQGMLALWERAGWVDEEEAAEWKRRISRAETTPGPPREAPEPGTRRDAPVAPASR